MAAQNADKQGEQTHVTLVFDREVTDEEVKQMQLQHNAIKALSQKDGGHHDHDHPKIVE
ncbi:hypothetical protein ACWD4N_32210 [Streptomyces sp. NPDC002586]